jgi:hypothetical protein
MLNRFKKYDAYNINITKYGVKSRRVDMKA